MIMQYLLGLLQAELPSVLIESFSYVVRRDKLRIVRVKMLEQGIQFFLGENRAYGDCGGKELWVINLSVTLIVNVSHYGLYLLVWQADFCILLKCLLQLIERNHTSSINVYFLEGLRKMWGLSFIQNSDKHAEGFHFQLRVFFILGQRLQGLSICKLMLRLQAITALKSHILEPLVLERLSTSVTLSFIDGQEVWN